MSDIDQFLVKSDTPIQDVMACIDRNAQGIALVVDAERHLLGTITDGDIRRAILDNVSLDAPAESLLSRKKLPVYARPVTAEVGTDPATLLQQMQQYSIRQIPLLDSENRIASLVTLDELLPEESLHLQAVVMAGGFGTRLRPLTEDVPKPMLPVGGRPLLERIIEQLSHAGIQNVSVTTHYKPEKIIDHFGDGHAFGVQMNYVNEDQPLGTGGALGLMPLPDEPVLVINGDILTQVNFRAMLDYHREHNADITMGVRRYEVQVPYGVVECSGPFVSHLREKPQLSFLVNAGMYLLEPSVFRLLPHGHHFNMTDLIQWFLDTGRRVVSFPVREYWLDIGQLVDYEQAQEDMEEGRTVM